MTPEPPDPDAPGAHDAPLSLEAAERLREELRLTASLAAEGFTRDGTAPSVQALAAASHLARAADRTLHLFVARRRAAGASWAQIGETLGITRQAAQKRFGAAPPQRVTVEQSSPDPALVTRARELMDAVAGHRADVLDEALSQAARESMAIGSATETIDGIVGVFGELVSRGPLEARVIAQVTVVTAREERTVRPASARLVLAPDGTLIGFSYTITGASGD